MPAILALLMVATAALAQDESAKPPEIELSPIVTRLIADPLTTDAERLSLKLFHGQWDGLDNLQGNDLARLRLAQWRLDDAVFQDDNIAAILRAEAALHRGDPGTTIKLLADDDSAPALMLKSQACEQLGDMAGAVAALLPLREAGKEHATADASQLTAVALALLELARLEGRPSHDYRLAMGMLAKVRTELDRLYWPSLLAEAKVLFDKDNPEGAQGAIAEALHLNPRSSQAWYLLGRMTAQTFQFDRARFCADKLREINPDHLLADLVDIESFLTQRDVPRAIQVAQKAMAKYPTHRELNAFAAAAHAMAYDDAQTRAAIERFDAMSPGNPLLYATLGRFLSLTRQYDAGAAALRRAIDMNPNWCEPRAELALLLMQSGDEENALKELRAAARLDPFNKRVANQLKLAEELQTYDTIRTEHFIIRYKPGVDEVLARDMPAELERIYSDITSVFAHRPKRTTLIELLPDEQWFGVRITGIPEIWTIAASTGDVIAMTPPRLGAKQRGTFDWARVIRHEFVHTVTLDKTANRLPHWFTEACAVSQEPGGRDYPTSQLLAEAVKRDKLFDLKEINWAFVRPKTELDRPLAYAQAHWMLQYITLKFRHQAVLDLLVEFRNGANAEDAIARVTGGSAESFMAGFHEWASSQVKAWGLASDIKDARVEAIMNGVREGKTPGATQLAELLAEYPNHPDLLELSARMTLQTQGGDPARQALMRYAAARPIDPWPHRELVKLATASGNFQEVLGSLQLLDEQEQTTGAWAHQLAKLYRLANDLETAHDAAIRSLWREPYNAAYRELAATIALQRGDLDETLRHLSAMTSLEPSRPIHFVRLAALHHRMGSRADAKAAAEKARSLDPKAPVDAFLAD